MSLSYGYEYVADSDIDMTEHRIFSLPNSELNSEPVTKEHADTHYSDFTMRDHISMRGHEIVERPPCQKTLPTEDTFKKIRT